MAAHPTLLPVSHPPAYGQTVPPQQPAPPYHPQQAVPYGWAPQPPQKSRLGMVLGIVAGVLLLACITGGGATWWIYNRVAADNPTRVPPLTYSEVRGERAPTHTVRFLISGSGQVKITWSSGDGTATETVEASLPWQKWVTVEGNNFRAFAIVQGVGSRQNVQLCNVAVDGWTAALVQGDGTSVVCATHFTA